MHPRRACKPEITARFLEKVTVRSSGSNSVQRHAAKKKCRETVPGGQMIKDENKFCVEQKKGDNKTSVNHT